MLRKMKLLSVILALIMALTITGQVPAFALENETPEQPVVEQSEGEDVAETEQQNVIPDENTEEGEVVEEEPTDTDIIAEDENTEEPEYTVKGGSVITASGLKNVPSPTSTKWDGRTIDISWYNPSSTEFTINTGAKLAGLAALVNGSYDKTITQYAGNTTQLGYIQCVKLEDFMFTGAGGGNKGGTCYKSLGLHDFMGKTVKITADLDMTSANYMPIGGKYPMCDANGRMFVNNEAGTGDAHVIEAYFNGVLDCGGHKIKINCNRYTESDYGYSMAAGLVGYIGRVIDEDEVDEYGSPFKAQTLKQNWAPAVKNVSLEGSVYARRMVGGIVGDVGNSWYDELGVFVENCANHANVKSTDAKGVGGIVGAGWGKGHIVNCYNTGTITSTYNSCPAGGICAENSGMDIYNCYNTGTIITPTINGVSNKYGRGIGGHNSGSYTIDNCYSLKGCDTDPDSNGWYVKDAVGVEVNVQTYEANQMKGSDFAEKLNKGEDLSYHSSNMFVYDENLCDGQPVLHFEKSSQPSGTSTVNVVASENGSFKCFYNGVFYEEGDSFTVPYGAAVVMTTKPDAGYILSEYRAGDETIMRDICTITADTNLSANIIALKKGIIKIDDENSTDCNVAVTKRGLDATGQSVKNLKVVDEPGKNLIYQKDVLTVSAVLFKDAYPDNVNKEYSGEFTYILRYENSDGTDVEGLKYVKKDGNYLLDPAGRKYNQSNKTGKFTIDESIDERVVRVLAIPEVRNKTWLSCADTSWYYDNNGEEYEIKTAEDLAGLAYLVNIEGETFSGETIIIPDNNTISLKNADGRGGEMIWPGIGISETACFSGTFDGNGNSILDMYRVDESGSQAGLFNYCVDADIKGVVIAGEVEVKTAAGGIAGYSESSTIENCINRATIKALEGRAGGITGQAIETVFSGDVNRGRVISKTGMGGIVGYCYTSRSEIKDCTNRGEIKSIQLQESEEYDGICTGYEGTGGICGTNYGNIIRCANYRSIISTDNYTGGLSGKSYVLGTGNYYSIQNSYNRGTVISKANASSQCKTGGIIGNSYNSKLINCYNAGNVNGKTPEFTGSCLGLLSGGTNSCIDKVYWEEGTCAEPYNHLSAETPDNMNPVIKTADEMKTEAFAGLLMSNDADSGFTASAGDYPEFSRIKASNIEKTCTVTFRGVGELNNKSFEINYGGSVSRSSIPNPAAWCKYAFTLNGEEWSGTNITSDVTVDVQIEENVQFNAVFKAGGETVAVKQYGSGASYDTMEKPETAGILKEGYAVTWPSSIVLNDDKDTVINAVYYPDGATIKNVQDQITVSDGSWYIGGRSTGTITIPSGAETTLIGDSGMCNDLNIIMEAGTGAGNTVLNAHNLQLSCDTVSVLEMNENCVLNVSGNKNHFEGTDTDSKDCVPAINIKGNCEINGEGTISATSETGDTVIDIADGKTLTFSSGTLKLYKDSKIGSFDGGVINSGDKNHDGTGSFDMSGGIMYCTSNSDNMHAVKVGSFSMSGGDALVVSNDEEKAIKAANMIITSGNLKVFAADYDRNETDKSEKNRHYYYNEKAIDCEAFTSNNNCSVLSVANMYKPYKVSIGDTTFNCQGLRLDYDMDKGKLVKTSDNNVYIWGEKEKEVSVAPDNPAIDMTSAENQRGYSVIREGDNVNISMTKTRGYKKTWYKACATYDVNGNMLQFEYRQISDNSALTLNTLSEDAATYKVFVLQKIENMVPGMASYQGQIN